MAKNCLFSHLGSQNVFWSYPPPLIRRWSIDCNSLVFFDNLTSKIRLKTRQKTTSLCQRGVEMGLKSLDLQKAHLGHLLNVHT